MYIFICVYIYIYMHSRHTSEGLPAALVAATLAAWAFVRSGSYRGQFSKAQSGKVGPVPGSFELSKGMLK